MNTQVVEKTQATRLFWLFIFLHLIGWTLVPSLVRGNLPLDAIEGTIWGHQLQWGYDKNPFMNGWLTALASYLSHHSAWSIYLFSQLFVVLAMWAVWKLANKITSPAYALVSVLLLELVQYFNFHAIDFNDNTIELGLWALATYYFYQAVTRNKNIDWLATGITVGLCMMAKYYTLALMAGMGLYLLSTKENRKFILSLKPYLALLAFCIVIFPHVIWLTQNDFISVHYVFARAGNQHALPYHFSFPFTFLWQQAQVFAPALILFGLFFFKNRSKENLISSTNKRFLIYVALAPILLTGILSLLFAVKLRAGWGMPLLTFWGLLLVSFVKPEITPYRLKAFYSSLLILLTSFLCLYSFSQLQADASTGNFPGKQIATTLNQEWQTKYHRPLKYVAGSRWVGGNIEFYAQDHPSVFVEWSLAKAPWINLADLRQQGAIFVWSISDKETMPEEVRQQFPKLQATEIRHFKYRGNQSIPPVEMGVAILPPASITTAVL